MAKRRTPGRGEARAELLARCAAVELGGSCDVAVVGGGASGLAAAIAAAEAGARTVVVERALECGRTILATGGGRCNFANADLRADAYNNPAFAEAAMGSDPLGAILSFFAESGLAWTEEEGRLYPRSMSAASVREVLLARARRAGAVLACGREAVAAERNSDGFTLRLRPAFDGPDEELSCSSLIIASGGGSAAFASAFGLPAREGRPGLCALSCKGLPFEVLDGRRVRVAATLLRDGRELAREEGELLFRPWGVSGIVVFDLSRLALPGDRLLLDLAPELDELRFAEALDAAGGGFGIVDPAVADVLEGHFGRLPKELSLEVTGTADEAHAQLTLGGLATSAFDAATLRAQAIDGLFACGEALDIDGRCGGYNLAFAWTSGLKAGASAAAWTEARR